MPPFESTDCEKKQSFAPAAGRFTVNVKWSNLSKAVILMFQLVNLDYFVVENDHSLVTFNYSISHLQLTIQKF